MTVPLLALRMLTADVDDQQAQFSALQDVPRLCDGTQSR
jgi:hypothetical protein